jgi:hypothetical protein
MCNKQFGDERKEVSMKKCTKCGVEKNESEFGKNKSRKDGLHWWCKSCVRVYHKRGPAKPVAKDGMKFCSKCGEEKDKGLFFKTKRSKDGLRSHCKICDNERKEAVKNTKQVDRKTCSTCKIEKDRCAFYASSTKDGLDVLCKDCRKAYRAKNKEAIRDKYSKRYYSQLDYEKERGKRYRETHKDEARARIDRWIADNPEKERDRHIRYRNKNRDRLCAARRKRIKARIKTDPLFAAKQRLRTATGGAFLREGYTKRSKSYKLVGCSIEELLEKWGVDKIPYGYEIDHIIPLAQATSLEEVEKLCHYRNLQLLPMPENRSKRDKKTEQNAALCVELLGREWID